MPPAPPPSRLQLFTPKFVSMLREGYGFAAFRADLIAGLTVAIVALPLSMAIAIASHAPPQTGLFTAIVGGFLISLLGGSRFQVGGPAGAFIVVLASIIDRHGLDGMMLVTLMAGVILVISGVLRWGTYIKYVPHPVTVGFTSGIAVIIFVSQLKELFGLRLAGAEPAAILPKVESLWAALPTLNAQAVAISALSIGIILILRKLRPHWPGFLIAVLVTSLSAYVLHLDVETIYSRFGDIPRSLPAPALPTITLDRLWLLLPDAFTVALLGGIESLLSAVVADSMSGRRHRSNIELVAQGIANMACAVFGGLTATGTIARTATNVRAGAHGPVAGMLHAVFVLVFLAVAAPLAGYIPLAALAGILAVVAWNMAERAEFKLLLTSSWGDAVVLVVTFLLVVFRDLTEGILVGVALGCLLFMHRMAEAIEVQSSGRELVPEDRAESGNDRTFPASEPDVAIHRITGAFFFGAASAVSTRLDQIGKPPKAHILDLSEVPFVDSTAAHSLHSFFKRAAAHGSQTYVAGATKQMMQVLRRHSDRDEHVKFKDTIAECLADFHKTATIKTPSN